MFGLKKYKLLPAQSVEVEGKFFMLHRIVATKDIHRYGIKRGDIGGLVSSGNTLSHKGDCWITEDAIVLHEDPNKVPQSGAITGDVFVTQNALLINSEVTYLGAALIAGKAFIKDSSLTNLYKEEKASFVISSARITDSSISGRISMTGNTSIGSSMISAVGAEVHLSEKASVLHSELDGKIRLSDNVTILHATLSGCVNVAGNAKVEISKVSGRGRVTIKDNATLLYSHLLSASGSTIHISGNVTLIGSVGNYTVIRPYINENVTLGGRTRINESVITGHLDATDEVSIHGSKMSGRNYLSGKVKIQPGAVLHGENHLSGETIVKRHTQPAPIIESKNPKMSVPATGGIPGSPKFPELPNRLAEMVGIAGAKDVYEKAMETHTKVLSQHEKMMEQSVADVSASEDEMKPHIDAIKDTLSDYDSYSLDIVKLLKYPAMADGTIPEVRDLMVAARKARRELKSPSSAVSMKAVANELEAAFIAAESKALTLSISHLDEKAKSSLKDASQRLAIACDAGATDNERKLGFKAGMKSLEGVIHVSDDAISAFKAKSGLLELEA